MVLQCNNSAICIQQIRTISLFTYIQLFFLIRIFFDKWDLSSRLFVKYRCYAVWADQYKQGIRVHFHHHSWRSWFVYNIVGTLKHTCNARRHSYWLRSCQIIRGAWLFDVYDASNYYLLKLLVRYVSIIDNSYFASCYFINTAC